MLSALVLNAKRHWPKIIAIYLDAWSLQWDSQTTNVRGLVLLEEFSELDVVLAQKSLGPDMHPRKVA